MYCLPGTIFPKYIIPLEILGKKRLFAKLTLWNNCYNYPLNKFLNCRTSQSLRCPNVHCESGIWSFRIIQDSFSLGTSFPGFSDQGALWQTVLQDLSSLIFSVAFSCIHSACLLHSCLYLLLCQRHWGLPKDADFTFAKALPSAGSYCCVGPLPLTQKHLGWRENWLNSKCLLSVVGWRPWVLLGLPQSWWLIFLIQDDDVPSCSSSQWLWAYRGVGSGEGRIVCVGMHALYCC